MAKEISLKELTPGDIILFSVPRQSKISILIGLITHSPVSHTGLVDRNPGYALQEVEEGASRRGLPEAGTRKLYIRRLKSTPDTTKVVDIAKKYVAEDLPYPMSNLAFLGMYILASDFIPDTLGGEIVLNVLKLATYELMKLVNEKRHPGTDVPPMVCSQFAAACYDEAALAYGPEYKIHYNEEVSTVASLLRRIIDQLAEEEEEKSYAVREIKHEHLLNVPEDTDPYEYHCDRFADHLQQREEKGLSAVPSKISDEIVSVLYQYGKNFLKLTGSTKEYPDKEEATADEIKAVLEELLRFQEAFVTPGDLLSNTTNLEDMGILTYTQDELDMYLERDATQGTD